MNPYDIAHQLAKAWESTEYKEYKSAMEAVEGDRPRKPLSMNSGKHSWKSRAEGLRPRMLAKSR